MITILKGDTSTAITITLADGYDYTGATVEVTYQNVPRSFTGKVAGDVLSIVYTAAETSTMALGAFPVTVRIIKGAGAVTLPNNGAKIAVTDVVADVTGGSSIIIDPGGGVLDFDVTPIPSSYSLKDLRSKINEIIAELTPSVPNLALAFAMIGFAAFGAGVTAQTSAVEDLANTARVVTNVTFDAAGLATTQYVNEAISGIAPGGGVTTNDVQNIVSESYIYDKGFVKGVYEDSRVINLSDYLVEINGPSGIRINYGMLDIPMGWSYIKSCDENQQEQTLPDYLSAEYMPKTGGDFSGSVSFGIEAVFQGAVFVDSYDSISDGDKDLNQHIDGKISSATNALATKTYVDDANATTRAIVSTWEGFLDGSNVVFSITNYMSGSYNLDAAKFRILEMTNGIYREVYNSRTEMLMHLGNFETNTIRPQLSALSNSVESAVANKADKDWGKYTSAGGVAPSNTVYMTAPNTVFAGGMEYERVAVGEGAVCVLTTKGAPVWTQGDEGTFKFQDDGGTNYFGFAKTDSYVIGADTDGISVANNIVTLTYNVTMSGVPCVWYKADLSSNTEWEQLNLPDGTAIAGASHVVSWEQTPVAGTEVCYINCPEAKGFFRATIEVAGSAKFMTNMPADLSGGILCTDGIHKVKIEWNGGSPRFVEAQ